MQEEITPGGGLLIRASNLGGKERVILGDPTGFETGIIRGIYAGTNLAVGGDSFVVYDSTSDAGGIVGFRSLKASEYTTGSVLQNPANGGTTPIDAFVLVDSAVTASGVSNTIDNLTLANGGSVSLSAGQSLAISSGSILARTGTSTISGGALSFGTGRADVYTTGELTIGSTIQGTGGLRKLGSGTLILSSAIGYTGGTEIADGTLRVGSAGLFASDTLAIHGAGVFDAGADSVSIGAITGTGTVNLNGGTLTVGGLGTSFTYSGGFSGNGQVVIESGGNPAALRTFNGSNTFAGNVVLNSSRLQLGSDNALGTGALIVNGGSLRTSPNVTISQDFVLNADLPLLGSNPIVFGPGASATGARDFVLRSGAAVSIQGNLTMTGRFRSQYGLDDEFVFAHGVITVQGPAGSLSTNAGVKIESGGQLDLNDVAAYAGGGEGRLSDTTPVHLGGGKLNYIGNNSISSAETFGALTGAGFSTVTLTPSATTTTSLTASSLGRDERGTFLFLASNSKLGAAVGPGAGQMFFQTPPALVGGGGVGTATSIIPWAIGLSGGEEGLLTYGLNGVRVLTSSEYVSNLSAAGSTSNVKLGFQASVDSPRTINSLSIDAVTLGGSSELSIVSGTILATGFTGVAWILPDLNFGSTEANFFFGPGSFAPLNVRGNIKGSGGLTVSGSGTLVISGPNQFTGPITINDGSLEFPNSASLGQGNELITLHGNSARLHYSGTNGLTLSRGVWMGGGISEVSSAGPLELPGGISGPGGLRIDGQGEVTLDGANFYEGPTLIDGSVAIASDASLGAGNLVYFTRNESKLRLNGNWTTSRFIKVVGLTIDTNGYEALITKPMESSANVPLVKTGAGALRLQSPESFKGSVTVLGGNLSIEQTATFPADRLRLGHGGSLSFDNSTVALSDRIPQSTFVLMDGGELRVLGHSTTPVNEAIGSLRLEPGTSNVITLTVPGSASTALTVSNFINDNGLILIRGDNLGGAFGSPFTRVVASSPTLLGGIMPGALADVSSTGAGSSFAVYDTSSDSAGPMGVRPLKPSEHVTDDEIRNPVNGGLTPVGAHYFANGATTAAGNRNRVSTLRLGGSASFALNPGQTLTLGAAHLLVDAGTNASFNGGVLNFSTQRAYLMTLGNLSLGSRITNPTFYKSGSGTLTLAGGAKVLGTLNLVAGALNVVAADALRSIRLNIQPGTAVTFSHLPATSGGIIGPGVVNLPNGMLTIERFFGDVKFTGSGGVTATGSGNFSVPQTFSGPLVITAKRSLTGVAGTTLSGDGTALNVSSVSIGPFASLYLTNEDKVLTRFGSVPVEMNGGQIVMSGGAATETFASLAARGLTTFQPYESGKLLFNEFTRLDRASLKLHLLDGLANSGSVDLPASVVGDLIGANTSPTTRAILPYAFANVSGNHSPVTFSPGSGLRPLNAGELSTTFSPGVNVGITAPGSVTNDANVTINSLSTVRDILGSGTLSIASGLLINNGASSITNALNFGAAEAHIVSNPGTSTLSGSLSGTGGLTKAGSGALVLPVTNNISGPLTINEGTISFADPAQLGLDTGEIFMHSGGVTWSGSGNFNFPRSVRLIGGPGVLGTTNPNGTLHITQAVTGPGDLKVVGRVVFDAAPAHTGETVLSGTLLLASDSSLGSSSQLTFAGGTLALTAPVTTNREFFLREGGTIDTAGFEAVLQGPLTGGARSFIDGGPLIKTGAGRLTVNNGEDFTGTLRVSAGSLEINSYLSGNVTGLSGSTVVMGGSIFGTLDVSGVLDLGPGTQTISANTLLMKPNSNLRLRLDSTSAHDQIISTSTPSLQGPIALELDILAGWDPTDNVDSFVLLENASDFPITVTNGSPFVFAGNPLTEGESFSTGNQIWSISYQGGSGNDVVLYAVPEPVTGVLLAAAASLVGLRRRRR